MNVRFYANAMQVGCTPGRETIEPLFVLQEEYSDKDKKLFICFVDVGNAFDRVSRKVIERAMEKARKRDL